jgi:hypothetical protein
MGSRGFSFLSKDRDLFIGRDSTRQFVSESPLLFDETLPGVCSNLLRPTCPRSQFLIVLGKCVYGVHSAGTCCTIIEVLYKALMSNDQYLLLIQYFGRKPFMFWSSSTIVRVFIWERSISPQLHPASGLVFISLFAWSFFDLGLLLVHYMPGCMPCLQWYGKTQVLEHFPFT